MHHHHSLSLSLLREQRASEPPQEHNGLIVLTQHLFKADKNGSV